MSVLFSLTKQLRSFTVLIDPHQVLFEVLSLIFPTLILSPIDKTPYNNPISKYTPVAPT